MNNDTDLSDDAFRGWYQAHPIRSGYPPKYNALDAWQECRRRSDLLTQCMNELHEAILQEQQAQMEVMRSQYEGVILELEERLNPHGTKTHQQTLPES